MKATRLGAITAREDGKRPVRACARCGIYRMVRKGREAELCNDCRTKPSRDDLPYTGGWVRDGLILRPTMRGAS